MPARLQNALLMLGKQIHHLRTPQLPKLNSEERTQLTWARVIGSCNNVPEIYKEFFETHLSNGQAFPYTVLTPAYETPGYKISEKLVCAFDHEIQVLERNGKALAAQCYPLAGISYVEVSSMLLDSRVKIKGVTSEGIPTSSIVRFSSATDYLLAPILKKIRLYTVAAKDPGKDSELKNFDHWSSLNFKFMNFARNSLLEREKIIHAILQPEIRRNLLTILGRTYFRTISPTHVSILTDRELIMIREEALQGREDKYGGIWDYIPLNKISALSVSRKNDKLLALSIQLLTNDCFEYLFQSAMNNEVDQFVDHFRKLTPG